MKQVTDLQLKYEREIQDVYNAWRYRKEITRDEGNQKVDDILHLAVSKKIFSQRDIDGYLQRRDKMKDNKPRDHMKFLLDLEKSHVEEGITFEYFINYLKEIDREPEWEDHGTDIGGFVMIANFWERFNSPNKPDKKVRWKRNGAYIQDIYVEVKNFGKDIWLKVNNLENYKNYNGQGAYLLIGFKNKYYFCKKNLVRLLLEKKSCAKDRAGKPSIIISNDGSNAHFSLQDLIERKYIKQI